MNIIAFNDGHNASAVLLIDGKIVAALQEERLTREKNKSGFPRLALDYILRDAGLDVTAVDRFLFVSNYLPLTTHNDREERIRAYKKDGSLLVATKNVAKKLGAKRLLSHFNNEKRAEALVALGVPTAKVAFVEHHLAHASAAYYGWGRFDERILVLTNDGAGDDLCATVSIGFQGGLRRIETVHMDHSIGELWALMTAMMGMVPLEHEYKLMGLAPYAPQNGMERVRSIFAESFEFVGDGLSWRVKQGLPSIPMSYNYFRDKLEFMRFDWIGAGLQRFTEDFLCDWVRNAIRKTGIRKLALSGGTFMNVKANKRILELDDVEDIYVFPSCGDETNPIGAAYNVFHQTTAQFNDPLGDLYLGTRYSSDHVRACFDRYSFKEKYRITKPDDVAVEVAQLIARGEVVAWFQGREEFGARALGHRSIVADPTKRNVINIINDMIKSRDFWMPFAASLLAEGAEKYLVNPKHIPSPYMIVTFDTTAAAEEIEAGRHPFDKTCRPQVVYEDWNEKYHRLLKEFKRLSGRCGVLNTSFNLHGLPIASSPDDAFYVLDNSGLTYLAIEDWLIEKVR